MKSLQFMSAGSFEVGDLPMPKILDDEVLLASRVVGICHSDVDLLEGRYIIPFEYPLIPGHEWSAEVLEVGRSVRTLVPGDRVVGECVIGEDHFGFTISGAAAEYFVAKPHWLHKIPDSITWSQGALIEPFSCGYSATLRADNPDASDTVVVLGAGTIGLGVIAASAAKGARVIVIEPTASRVALARRLGAEQSLDPTSPTFLQEWNEMTSGAGASVVIEATGKPEAMATALELAGIGARVVNVGINVGDSTSARLGLIQSKELQIRGIIGSPGIWPQTIAFLDRTGIDLSPLVSSIFPLAEADQAMETVLNDKSQVKVHMMSSAA